MTCLFFNFSPKSVATCIGGKLTHGLPCPLEGRVTVVWQALWVCLSLACLSPGVPRT